MKKRKENKKFEWAVLDNNLNLDHLEIQLHSLHKMSNINFNEFLFIEDLKKSDGYSSINSYLSIQLAIKSFALAFIQILKSHGVNVEKIDSKSILLYGEYELKTTNIIASETRSLFKTGLTGMSNGVKLSKKSRVTRVLASPLSFISLIDSETFITKGAATKKMLENLILWEKSVVESSIRQLKKELFEGPHLNKLEDELISNYE